MKQSPILVTGGAGFIGSNFVLEWMAEGLGPVVVLDKLTYAGNRRSLEAGEGRPDYRFVRGDINDAALVQKLFSDHRPRAIVHLAAESHVDRSILGPEAFVDTNIRGTMVLLMEAERYFAGLAGAEREQFRFLHVSTDEVYGDLGAKAPAFDETAGYTPSSPYAASKAAADHLVRAWQRTHGLPCVITNCSNNYGPRQFPEKLVPLVVLRALAGETIPIYGDGQQVRDWLHVSDHCRGLRLALERGRVGETYNLGGGNQPRNRELAERICALLDELVPQSKFAPHGSLIRLVEDRPGHDRRYALDTRKAERELEWHPMISFEDGMRSTVKWYLENRAWVESVRTGEYRRWMDANYSERMAGAGI
jgi:dTDP-glucose 4,6-dehydratase